jgi:hypothetical protein
MVVLEAKVETADLEVVVQAVLLMQFTDQELR